MLTDVVVLDVVMGRGGCDTEGWGAHDSFGVVAVVLLVVVVMVVVGVLVLMLLVVVVSF